MTIEQLVTDEAVAEVFKYTRFGIPVREVISDTLKQVKDGITGSATARMCCRELGLILYVKPMYYELSIIGKKYLELLKEAEHENKAD